MRTPDWQSDDGAIQLHCCDCMELLPTIPTGTVDACVTSPPYGNIREYGGHKTVVDNMIPPLSLTIGDGGVIVWNEADQVIDGSESCESFKHALMFRATGLRLHDTMIYCKEAVTFPDANRYHPAFEYMFVFSRGTPSHFNGIKDRKNKWGGDKIHGSRREANGDLLPPKNNGKTILPFGLRWNWWIMNTASQEERIDHPARMPMTMARDHVLTWTVEEQTILDPFLGSGTTTIACIRTGRRFIGCEIDKGYFDIAVKRVKQELSQPRLFKPEPVKTEQASMFGGEQ